MPNKKFDAILAKNELARCLGVMFIRKDLPIQEAVPFEYMLEQLKTIEACLGTANQPNVIDCYSE